VKCPACGSEEHRVLRGETTEEGALRRRRECKACSMRFWTIEALEVHYTRTRDIADAFEAMRRLLPGE
jgi:transcriptional repressor NrdR